MSQNCAAVTQRVLVNRAADRRICLPDLKPDLKAKNLPYRDR